MLNVIYSCDVDLALKKHFLLLVSVLKMFS